MIKSIKFKGCLIERLDNGKYHYNDIPNIDTLINILGVISKSNIYKGYIIHTRIMSGITTYYTNHCMTYSNTLDQLCKRIDIYCK